MRTFIRRLAVVGLLAGGTRRGMGQTPTVQTPTQPKHYPLGLEAMLAGVSLSPRQRVRVDSIADQYWMKMDALRPVLDGAPMETRQKAAKEQRTQLAADVEKVLIAEQIVVFRKNVDAGGRRGASPP